MALNLLNLFDDATAPATNQRNITLGVVSLAIFLHGKLLWRNLMRWFNVLDLRTQVGAVSRPHSDDYIPRLDRPIQPLLLQVSETPHNCHACTRTYNW